MTHHHWSPRPSGRGHVRSVSSFSLVELVFAVAIFSFCIVSLIYLLDVALTSLGRSKQDSAMDSVLHTIDAQLRAAATTNIGSASYSTNYYFDSTGSLTNITGSPVLYRVLAQRINPTTVNSLMTTTGTNTTGTTGYTNGYYLWSVQVSYPPNSYPKTNYFLIGHAYYDNYF